MIQGLVQLFIFQALGELVSKFALPFIPGPVLGLVLLLVYLSVRGHVPTSIDLVGGSILQHLGLLFIPASMAAVPSPWGGLPKTAPSRMPRLGPRPGARAAEGAGVNQRPTFQAIAQDALARVKELTPVRTGNLRANWQVVVAGDEAEAERQDAAPPARQNAGDERRHGAARGGLDVGRRDLRRALPGPVAGVHQLLADVRNHRGQHLQQAEPRTGVVEAVNAGDHRGVQAGASTTTALGIVAHPIHRR